MSKVLNFYDLDVWQQAHRYRLEIFYESNKFPQKYQFTLGQQIQRAAISVSSNIAEGFGRQNKPEKKQFYRVARGSLTETQDQLILARDLSLVSDEKFDELQQQAERVHQLISGLLRSLDHNKATSELRISSSDGAIDG